ncbi:TonB-dependent receptor domain-containing protein [Flavobacterium sp. LHD-85]|uniref:TonB-dependent receptor n=1 Tax=Flavobacterium sp. LHD-85 TaxID=3071410 RepID=UPI0027DEDFBF|nr:TonB-dependent receptor [Flavobacterium sp. LHD-85]MDQ6530967.1 TonB-dependent receptor [Flavobacterium sp. LHD-85]
MKYFVLLFLFIATTISAQQHIVKGHVVESITQKPLQSVTVLEVKSNKWTITDENGYFEIKLNDIKEFSLNFRLLGKQEKSIVYTKEQVAKSIIVELENDDLRLKEIIVSARKGKNFSEIIMGREAINQVQAFSLSDVLEQLPGQATTNFDMNEFKTIAFRTVKPSFIGNSAYGNKSFGTSIVVDGIPISNNENMQSYAGNYGIGEVGPFSPNLLGFGDPSANDFNGYFSNANFGADLRQISTGNIEKIEVVQGIPSAKYGDLTSGLIKIEQKAGQSPFRVYASLRDGTSEYGFSKGFKISDKFGFLNAAVNYTKSNSEPRVSYTKYDRVNTNLMWSWANKNIRNSFSVDYGFNNDNVNYEAEGTDDKIVKNKKTDLSISNRFKMNFSESFFDNLDVNFNFSHGKQNTFESELVNVGGTIVGTSTTEGVYTGTYTMPSYTTVKAVEGIPISSFLSADLYKSYAAGSWMHNMSYGTAIRMSDNKGRGRLGSPETMNSAFTNTNGGSGQAFRPYNYADNILAEYQFSLYAEDNIVKNWSRSALNIDAGLRYDNQYGYSFLAPRINASYAQDNFKIRGGFGLTSKAPSLNQVYTGPRYYDAVLGDYRLPGYYNLGIVQTFIDFSNNENLKPSKSLRSEIGFDYKLPFATVNITGFYNNLYDGITSQSLPTARQVADLQINYNGNQTPTYDITGYSPFYYLQTQLVNKYLSKDRGVEFFMNFDKTFIKNISFDLNGSYIETTNRNDIDSYYRSTNVNTIEKFGVYKPYDEHYKSFSLAGNLSYHLPKIGMVIAVRSEHFIVKDNNYNKDNLLYAYLDQNLNKVLIPAEDQNNKVLYGHILKTPSVYDRELQKVYHNFNLRVSKDFLNGFRFSFYANNFLDLKQTEIALVNGTYVQRIKPDMVQLSFGTKIEYQF